MWLILYILWGVDIISSQVFGHLRLDPDWSLCNSYPVAETEKQIET